MRQKSILFLLCIAMLLPLVLTACGGTYSGEPDVTEMDLPEDGSEYMEDPAPPLGDEPQEGEPKLTPEQRTVQEVIDLVNKERTAAGLEPLEAVEEITAAAMVRAQEVAALFSHTRPDGTKYKTALEAQGVPIGYVGENVGGGYRSPAAVVEGWMKSSGHKANILHEKYTQIGAGWYTNAAGRQFWVLLFVRP